MTVWRKLCAGAMAVAVCVCVVGCHREPPSPPPSTEVQRVGAGDFNLVLHAPGGVVRSGSTEVTLEFLAPETDPPEGDQLLDVGVVQASATPAKTPDSASRRIEVRRTETAGRYVARVELPAPGTWQLMVEWDGRKSRGSVRFDCAVQ